MSFYDTAGEMKDNAKNISDKLDNVIDTLRTILREDEIEGIKAMASEAIDILNDINGEIY